MNEDPHFCLRGGDSGLQTQGRLASFTAPSVRGSAELAFLTPSHGAWSLFLAEEPDGSWTLSDEFAVAVADRPWSATRCRRLPAGTLIRAHADGSYHTRATTPSYEAMANGTPSRTPAAIEDAVAWVDEALRHEAEVVAARPWGTRLLLSGGVDSGLLASYLMQVGAAATAFSLRTPWGDELGGARLTAAHVGIDLEVVEVTADQIVAEIPLCMRWIQTADAELVAIHLLASFARRLALAQSADLVTGLGSDLLNSRLETGMQAAATDLTERVRGVSSSGLMTTGEPGDGPRMIHPYWTPRTIPVQLAVPDELKSAADGDRNYDKFYLRQLAASRLPREIAFGTKVAIHEGSGLVPGVERTVGCSFADYCDRAWTQANPTTPPMEKTP